MNHITPDQKKQIIDILNITTASFTNLTPAQIIKRKLNPFYTDYIIEWSTVVHNDEESFISREKYEKDYLYAETSLKQAIENVYRRASYLKINLIGATPVPFTVSLGYISSTHTQLGTHRIKIRSKKYFGKKEAKLINNFQNYSNGETIKIAIFESKKETYNEYDYIIEGEERYSDSKWIFSKKTVQRNLNNLFMIIQEHNIENDKKIKNIEFDIIASPSVCFEVGRFIQKHKYNYIINHFSERESKSINSIKISNMNIECLKW